MSNNTKNTQDFNGASKRPIFTKEQEVQITREARKLVSSAEHVRKTYNSGQFGR